MWPLYTDLTKQIFRYLPYYTCILRAVCKSWRDVCADITKLDQFTWIIVVDNRLSKLFAGIINNDWMEKISLSKSLWVVSKRSYPHGHKITYVSYISLINGRCTHLACENPKIMLRPTTYEYWETLIDMETSDAGSLLMMYVTKYQYGATWLMKKCYERGKIELALQILNTINVTAQSTRYIETIAKHTKLITALTLRMHIHREYLIEIAARNYNVELLDILFSISFNSSDVRTVLFHSHYTSHHRALVTWLYNRCNPHCDFISTELTQQIAKIYRQ